MIGPEDKDENEYVEHSDNDNETDVGPDTERDDTYYRDNGF